MANWTPVMPLDEFPEAKATVVVVDEEQVLLWRSGERIFAILNGCTHQGSPLDRGVIKPGSEPTVTCPAHGSMFRMSDGRVMRPPAQMPVPVYEVRVTDGNVELLPPDL
jgi:nitrite reductase/ring-hydroxylating ferredoxin subunit